MPIYMDLHIIPGVTAKDVAKAHLMDTMLQGEYNCKCMTYWVDEARGQVFCLIDAPTKDVVKELHQKAHGLVPHRIIDVQESLVASFLGRINDPEDTEVSDGLKLINDPSYRVLVIIKMHDHILSRCRYGKEKAAELVQKAHEVIHQELQQQGGEEAEYRGDAFIASFVSAANAYSWARSVQQNLVEAGIPDHRIAIHAGVPVSDNEKLFGETIQLAEHLCFIAKDRQLAFSSAVKQLVFKDHFEKSEALITLPANDELFLQELFAALEQHWQDSDFNMDDYCKKMAMSRSQLYRRTLTLSGFSPNALLKEYRLERSKSLLKNKSMNISQVTFDAGFSSPSYFTKCFKKKYGILPMAYLDMLQ